MSPAFPTKLLAYLLKPESYPHKPDNVIHIQTHASHLFIVSPYVFKFKKAVDFGFMDFRTLKNRKENCDREITLNRRLCSDIYLEVVPVYKNKNIWSFDQSGNNPPAEYGVKMNLLPADCFLTQIIKRGELNTGHIDRIVDKLVPFYRSGIEVPEQAQIGNLERIRQNTGENIIQSENFVGFTLGSADLNAIRQFTHRFLQKNQSLFEERIKGKRIVDGHGDLHLEHINIRDDNICIYDCIEFNDRFRILDIAEDVAFLSMDLDASGLEKYGRYFLEKMAEKLDDPGLLKLTDFYKCYRAGVRGKVKSLESRDKNIPNVNRKQAENRARNYYRLALRYALFGSTPLALIVTGRVATGKSTLAHNMSRILGSKLYSSDSVRKMDAGLPPDERTPDFQRKDLYSEAKTSHTYNRLTESAIHELRMGKSVVLDATFGDKEKRNRLRKKLKSGGYRYLFIEAEATVEIRKERLAEREKMSGVVSDARLEDIGLLDERYEVPDEIQNDCIIHTDTGAADESVTANLYNSLLDHHFSIIE